jgi:hypothetical protein
MQYIEYLKTKHWVKLRKNKYKHKKACSLCDSKVKLNVHHLRYKDLFNINTHDLKVVCQRCHIIIHNGIKNKELVFNKDNPHHIGARTRRYVRYKLGIYKGEKPKFMVQTYMNFYCV